MKIIIQMYEKEEEAKKIAGIIKDELDSYSEKDGDEKVDAIIISKNMKEVHAEVGDYFFGSIYPNLPKGVRFVPSIIGQIELKKIGIQTWFQSVEIAQ